MPRSIRSVAVLVMICVIVRSALAQDQAVFRVVFDPQVRSEAYSGRVYVAFMRSDRVEPRTRMNAWFNPPPLLAVDVIDIQPGGSVLIGASALSHPVPLDEIEPGAWRVQAVARVSRDSPRPGTGPGDLYSDVLTVDLGDGRDQPIELVLNSTVQPRAFPESETVRLFEITSERLSAFHGRSIAMHAGVVLPDGWAENPDKRYPIVYQIPGFGGSHFGALGMERSRVPGSDASKCINVVLDATCYRGHSVFADSANNGPWGSALVEELIPALEREFRGPLDARYRFVTGGSSGGWASLWLQVAYPDAFGACFSHVPDPVDFSDFQRIDLYTPGTNLFVDEHEERRPLARRGERVILWYDSFVARETVLGPGGQISSFEACFSPRGDDGEPLPVFDRDTGQIDAQVGRAWEKYDIRLVLQRNWEQLEPSLAGKIHVYAGEVDTYYLEGATRLLKATLDRLGADAEIEIIDGMAHQRYPPWEALMYQTLLARWERAQAGGD